MVDTQRFFIRQRFWLMANITLSPVSKILEGLFQLFLYSVIRLSNFVSNEIDSVY